MHATNFHLAGSRFGDLCFPIVDSGLEPYEIPFLFREEDGLLLLEKYARVTTIGYTTRDNFVEVTPCSCVCAQTFSFSTHYIAKKIKNLTPGNLAAYFWIIYQIWQSYFAFVTLT